MNRWSVTAVLGLTLSAALGLVSSTAPSAPHYIADEIDPNRPECPHDYEKIARPLNSEIVNGPVLPGTETSFGGEAFSLTSSIPEFNDCQRIILEPGDRYGPLMSVFASDSLGHLRFDKGDAPTTRAIAAVQVLNYSTGFHYGPLGIGPMFNCLYVATTGSELKAVMIKQGPVNKCEPTKDITNIPRSDNPTWLAVVKAPRFDILNHEYDFPAAARWEWDAQNKVQVIGLRCGIAWCHVGPGTATGAPAFTSESPYAVPASPGDRVRAIQGWYDVQQLAFVRRVNGRLIRAPSSVTGYVFPDSNLGRYEDRSNFRGFRPVAYIALESSSNTDTAAKYYKSKFNYDVLPHGSELSKMTELALCYGSWSACAGPAPRTAIKKESCGGAAALDRTVSRGEARWWARLTSHVSGSPMYRCVTQRLHKNPPVPMPATTRWRWIINDETTWDYCTTGCCETEGDQPSGT